MVIEATFQITENVELGIDTTIEIEFERLLHKLKLVPEDLLYRAVSGGRMPQRLKDLKEKGADYPGFDSIMALTYELVFVTPDSPTLFDYADRGKHAVIAIYDRSRFHPESRKDMYEYKFRDPEKKLDALLAVIKIEYK
jgi:hypothetical protein